VPRNDDRVRQVLKKVVTLNLFQGLYAKNAHPENSGQHDEAEKLSVR